FALVPYSIGLLQAYVQKQAQDPGQYEFLTPIYKRIPTEDAVEQLIEANIVGFSAYVWNIRASLAIARELKRRRPNILIVFGGPQVPDHAEGFLRENPCVDIVCHGEGERIFLEIVETQRSCEWDGISSVSYLRADGAFVSQPKLPRLSDLSAIPSPYLDGVFDSLMQSDPRLQWLAVWETNRGCPFSCSFCDWGSAVASKVYRFDMDRLKSEMDWFAQHRVSGVVCCDANFGILPRDVEIAEYLVETYRRHRWRVNISVQSAKNSPERTYRIQKTFVESKVAETSTTISLQSINMQTLESIKRDNISLDAFQELQRRYTHDGIETYTDMIVGLPGESYDSFADGIAQVMQNGQHNRIAFYSCSILPNAEMGDPDYQRRFGMVHVPIQIVRAHASLDETRSEETEEYLGTVIATTTMPADDWVRAKVFAWAVEMFHFDRLLCIPFIIMNEAYDLSYRDLVECLLDAAPADFPALAGIREALTARALAIQAGEPEYCPDEQWLNLWWPVDQHTLIRLATAEKLPQFYREVEDLLGRFLETRQREFDPRLLHDAIALNQSLFRVPFHFDDLDIESTYNVLECYRAVLAGLHVPLVAEPRSYRINRTDTVWVDWESWCEDLILRLYRRNSYLYSVTALRPAFAAAD
ncbi:MAG: B12-binding domain-containing radical SAM protein, partial [Dehalococcoidia bacterium]